MKASIVGHILILLGVLLLTGYIVFAIITFSAKDAEIVCNDLIIDFPLNEKNRLYSKNDILELLDNAEIHPIGESFKDIKTEKIEKKLLGNFLIDHVECFKTPSGKVFISINQRIPKYLIAGNQCLYVDKNRKIMPAILDHPVYIPVVTGHITKSFAEGELFDFVSFLEENVFWNAQIEQIYINKDFTVELVTRVGNAVILLGKLDNFGDKLGKLKLLYTDAFPHIGWDRYEVIDLQYEKQIVCLKSDHKPKSSKEVIIQQTDTIKKEQ